MMDIGYEDDAHSYLHAYLDRPRLSSLEKLMITLLANKLFVEEGGNMPLMNPKAWTLTSSLWLNATKGNGKPPRFC